MPHTFENNDAFSSPEQGKSGKPLPRLRHSEKKKAGPKPDFHSRNQDQSPFCWLLQLDLPHHSDNPD